MKAGFFLGYTEQRGEGKIVANTEYQTMEEFMLANGITDTAQIVWLLPADSEYAQEVKQAVVKCALIYLHGSDDPRYVSAARNTSLFEPHGPALGDIGGKLRYPLRQFFAMLKEELLPKIPARLIPKPDGTRCAVAGCTQTFPEDDGFKGVRGSDGVLRCFACYLKNEEANKQ